MTWPADTLARANDIIARYPKKRSAVMPLLYMAMKEDGRLTDDGMRQVAELTGLTPAQVQSVASFYVMYKTEAQGKYLVSVCSSISCFLLGADDVLHAVEQAAGVPAGEADDEIGVEHAECIGACGGAPACLVNFELVEGLTPEKAKEMIDWLRNAKPDVINADELQTLFGGRRSFDWAIKDENGAVGPYPAFPPFGTAAHNTPPLEPGRLPSGSARSVPLEGGAS
ncbi:MAG TPA: NAD(P)H-dependent oxidoreductase subunit E [Acidimicrobiia bacterium]|nr:NAD(P)H-dependent oxidoreductase subunit E [Acidimicrobiia bacterium]